jgi:hypothetical protein
MVQSSASMKYGIGDASTSLERWVLNLRGYWLLWRPDQDSNLGTGAIGTTRRCEITIGINFYQNKHSIYFKFLTVYYTGAHIRVSL